MLFQRYLRRCFCGAAVVVIRWSRWLSSVEGSGDRFFEQPVDVLRGIIYNGEIRRILRIYPVIPLKMIINKMRLF
jgi:hypothetical protein